MRPNRRMACDVLAPVDRPRLGTPGRPLCTPAPHALPAPVSGLGTAASRNTSNQPPTRPTHRMHGRPPRVHPPPRTCEPRPGLARCNLELRHHLTT